MWAWRGILERIDRPAGLVLSRQNLPVFDRAEGEAVGDLLACASGVLKGAYILAQGTDVALIATGSEVAVALEARTLLSKQAVSARVISMPCISWFNEQSNEYRESVLPSSMKARVSVEAGTTLPWHSIIGDAGECIGIDQYGESASGNVLMRKYGITAENVAAAAIRTLHRVRG